MNDKKPPTVDEIVDQLINLWKKGVSPKVLKESTENYLLMLKLSGNEPGYNELIPKIRQRQRIEIISSEETNEEE